MKRNLKNYYDILEIPKFSKIDIISAAYKRLVKKYHPDMNIGKPKSEVAKLSEKFNEINLIYFELSNPKKKISYDNSLILNEKKSMKSEYFDDSWGKYL